HTCVPELITAFTQWIEQHIKLTDGFICISRSVSGMLRDYIGCSTAHTRLATHPEIEYFHLGSELDLIRPGSSVRQVVKLIFEHHDRHLFMMVGTIEPRKMHSYVLDAFDRFWEAGGEGIFLVIGRHSWKTDQFLARVAAHPQLHERLFIIRDATDV